MLNQINLHLVSHYEINYILRWWPVYYWQVRIFWFSSYYQYIRYIIFKSFDPFYQLPVHYFYLFLLLCWRFLVWYSFTYLFLLLSVLIESDGFIFFEESTFPTAFCCCFLHRYAIKMPRPLQPEMQTNHSQNHVNSWLQGPILWYWSSGAQLQ